MILKTICIYENASPDTVKEGRDRWKEKHCHTVLPQSPVTQGLSCPLESHSADHRPSSLSVLLLTDAKKHLPRSGLTASFPSTSFAHRLGGEQDQPGVFVPEASRWRQSVRGGSAFPQVSPVLL